MPPTRRRLLSTAAATVVAGTAGCLEGVASNSLELATPEETPEDDWTAPDWEPADGEPTEDDVEPTTVVSGLEIPWDLTFAGEDAFVTERDGGLLRFDADDLETGSDLGPGDAEAILEGADLPDRSAPGEGGTLGVAAHPDYPEESVLFVYYTVDDDGVGNRVVRYDLESGDLEPILDGIPGATTHNGGRIAFGPDGYLWVLTGDAEEPALTQNPGSLAGAVLRIDTDGDPAPDNPDWGDGESRTYTLGHRNPQGIDFTPQGTPVIAEHGPAARDEVAMLRPGGNYGWNVTRGGPDDPEYENYDEYEAVTPPLVNTGPETTWAPSGLTFYEGDALEAWQNRLFVCGLVSETLYGVTLRSEDDDGVEDDDADAVYDDPWLDDRFTATVSRLFESTYGRLRHVEPGPEGSLYLLTSNRDGRAGGEFPLEDDDRIVRLESV